MKKWGFLIMGLLLVGLVVGITVPAVMASRSASPGDETSLTTAAEAELAEVAADLEEADPVTDNATESKEIKLLEVTLGGGFQGVWGSDNAEEADSTGSLVGFYGRVKRAGGREANYFKGIWLTDNGTVFGYLRGTCSDNGTFRGTWGNPETGEGGPLEGTYSPTDSDNVTSGEFNGAWKTRMEKEWLLARHLVPGSVGGARGAVWRPLDQRRPALCCRQGTRHSRQGQGQSQCRFRTGGQAVGMLRRDYPC